MPIFAFEGFVLMQYGLHIVIAGRNVCQAPFRIPKRTGIDRCRLAGFETVHVDTKNLGRLDRIAHLCAGLRLVGFCQNQHHAPIECSFALGGRKRDRERCRADGRLRVGCRYHQP